MSAVDTGNATIDVKAASPSSRGFSAARLLFWSVRRELWQHRSIFIAPALVGAFFVAASLLAAINGSELIRQLQDLGPARRAQYLSSPLMVSAEVLRFIAFVTAVAFSLSTFHGERRDRTILFWKSLPVSDPIAVAAKAAVPLLVTPLIALAAIVVTHLLIMLIASVAFAVAGVPLSSLWADSRITTILPGIAVTILFQTLWQAPVYAYLLMVSGWAARMPALWVILAPLGLVIFESYVFGTSWILDAIKARFTEGFVNVLSQADRMAYRPSAVSDALAFLTAPSLWAGLAVAAVFIVAAVWMRRRAEPI